MRPRCARRHAEGPCSRATYSQWLVPPRVIWQEPFYVFERCDVVALPSIGKEGLPNVLLEALAMEKPCVATRSYGSPEVVVDGKTGYCFPSGDVDALADALAQIAKTDDVTRAAMAAAGKALVFSEHDKSVQFEKILRIIQEKAAATMM